MYCLEAADHAEPISSFYLPAQTELKAEKEKALFGGVVVIKGFAQVAAEQDWHRRLYQPLPRRAKTPLKAIPYYAWDNRKPGDMKVWLPVVPPAPKVGGLESRAKVSVSFANNNSQPSGINDGIEPRAVVNNRARFVIGGRTRARTSGCNTPGRPRHGVWRRKPIGSTTLAGANAACPLRGKSSSLTATSGSPSPLRATMPSPRTSGARFRLLQ